MSEFKRKTQSSGFEAGEGSFDALESAQTPPDFSALEAESGFSAGQAEKATQSPEPVVEQPVIPIERRSKPDIESAPARPAAETPGKKRYYSPGEVMQKKGCIGCGGMALAIPMVLTVMALAIALF